MGMIEPASQFVDVGRALLLSGGSVARVTIYEAEKTPTSSRRILTLVGDTVPEVLRDLASWYEHDCPMPSATRA